jgi:hypothetical protein
MKSTYERIMSKKTSKELKNFNEEYEKTEIKLKKNLNVKIDYELLDKLRDIVYYTPGSTLSDFVEVALKALLDGYSDDRKRPSQLKRGRKVI